ncbi:MAG: 4Fe-4S binding protein [Bacteroidales bacterium]|nr:4Fe-4S binding protein [Bacteroidales bacterium]
MEECPVGAIKSDGIIYYIDERVCIGCGRCMDLCPVGAIWMEQFD